MAIKKKGILKRIYILNDGREPFLNFLRNLTPQILIFALLLNLATMLNFSKFDLSNTKATLYFYLFVAMFLLACYANFSLFLRHYRKHVKRFDKMVCILRKRGYSPVRASLLSFYFVWQRKRVELIESVFVVGLLPIALGSVIILGLQNADNIWRFFHHKG